VGGDYCEVMALDDHRTLFFAVGDVAGKGVAASLLMTHLSAIFRSLLSMGLPLSDMMARANRLFCESTDPSHYATLVCGRASGDQVEFCNAGHCRPLLVNAKRVEPFDSTGLPLGLFCGAEYPPSHARLAAGDSLVLYTDGVTEARHGAEDEFGEGALIRCLEQHARSTAEALAHDVLLDVDRFRAGTRPHDDVTLLVLRRSNLV
jgi:phosphoserine phosphatase RsbU/P